MQPFGKPKVLVSLGTSDHGEARRRRDERPPAIYDRFAELRAARALTTKVRRRDLSASSRADLERLAMGFYRGVLLPAAKSRPADPEEHSEQVDGWSEVLASHLRQDEAGSDAVRATTDLVRQREEGPTERVLIGSISSAEVISVDRSLTERAPLCRPVWRRHAVGNQCRPPDSRRERHCSRMVD